MIASLVVSLPVEALIGRPREVDRRDEAWEFRARESTERIAVRALPLVVSVDGMEGFVTREEVVSFFFETIFVSLGRGML